MPEVRNLGYAPDLRAEGVLVKPMPVPEGSLNNRHWHEGMDAYDRLHFHQTLASVRRYTHFKPVLGLIPEDSLDILLAAQYDHGADLFGEKADVVLQGYTMGIDQRRKTRNSYELILEKDAISRAVASALEEPSQSSYRDVTIGGKRRAPKKYEKYNEYHLLHVGGITERRHPSNVKLMNSSHHSPQTNAGYCRQDSDGNAYQY